MRRDSRAGPRIAFHGIADENGATRRIVAFVWTVANRGGDSVVIAEFKDPKDADTLGIGLSVHSRVLFATPDTLAELRGRPWLSDPRFEIEADDNEWLVVADSEQRHIVVVACRLEQHARLLAETFSKAERVRL